jgi:hypothetical protein
VFCLRGGEPCRQVVEVHLFRRVAVKRPVRSFLIVEHQVLFQAVLDRADRLIGVQIHR